MRKPYKLKVVTLEDKCFEALNKLRWTGVSSDFHPENKLILHLNIHGKKAKRLVQSFRRKIKRKKDQGSGVKYVRWGRFHDLLKIEGH